MECSWCSKELEPDMVYRCVDCSQPFCQSCLDSHCGNTEMSYLRNVKVEARVLVKRLKENNISPEIYDRMEAFLDIYEQWVKDGKVNSF